MKLLAVPRPRTMSLICGRIWPRTGLFLARMDGIPAAAMMYTTPLDGLTELAGGTTIAAYRRRGIGTAMIAAAAANAFARGVEIAFLTAASEYASSVFQRAGFRWYGTGLAYCEEAG